MEVALPLEKMSIKEKIQTMEAIWDDLCKKEESIPSPSWHKKVLKEREDSVKKGDDEFVSWNSAKRHVNLILPME